MDRHTDTKLHPYSVPEAYNHCAKLELWTTPQSYAQRGEWNKAPPIPLNIHPSRLVLGPMQVSSLTEVEIKHHLVKSNILSKWGYEQKKLDTFSHIVWSYGQPMVPQSHLPICRWKHKGKNKRNIIAIGQKHTQHKINKYICFCPIDAIHYSITLHIPHTKFLSYTFWHFTKTTHSLKPNVSVKILLHTVGKVLNEHFPTKYWGNGHKGCK